MRYIGNKTKLLSFIGDFLEDLGLSEGRALDAFAGTASVGFRESHKAIKNLLEPVGDP